ncbi:hypothetical protein ABDB91_11170 [Desulfoscipio sp. XC116]|uniref:hypothetical protein n=1 Tax=Desulfoscipio sp. XC116 TaxID=3144975 RepID=UPI00325C1F48
MQFIPLEHPGINIISIWYGICICTDLKYRGCFKCAVTVPVVMPFRKHELDYILQLSNSIAAIIPYKYNNHNYYQIFNELKGKHKQLDSLVIYGEKKVPEDTISLTKLINKINRKSMCRNKLLNIHKTGRAVLVRLVEPNLLSINAPIMPVFQIRTSLGIRKQTKVISAVSMKRSAEFRFRTLNYTEICCPLLHHGQGEMLHNLAELTIKLAATCREAG